MQRLGKNLGKYLGEGIEIAPLLQEIESAAIAQGWWVEEFTGAGCPRLVALKKSVPNAKRNLYISTGIHGDEPAGPLAIRELFRANAFPEDTNFWLIPCLNPGGFTKNQRENLAGIDLNRDYLNSVSAETRAHIAWLDRQPRFDISLCLHEDWESNGFYLYEQNPDHQPSYARNIIKNVAEVCPIDQSEIIEERAAVGGVIQPVLDPADRPQWPEALYLITHHTRLSYTIEAPSDFALATRVAAILAAVKTVLREEHSA